MNKIEFIDAMRIAKDSTIDLQNDDMDIMYGCGLPDFQPVSVSTRQVARLIRWQAQCFDGTWDSEAVNEVRQIGRRMFEINNKVGAVDYGQAD